MKKFLNKYSIIIYVACAILTLLSLLIINVLESYNILYILMGISLLFLYKNTNYKSLDKKYSKAGLLLGTFFSILLVLGYLTNEYIYVYDKTIILSLFSPKYILSVIGFIPLFYYLLYYLFSLKIKVIDKKYKISNKMLFVLSLILIIVCYLPYFMSLFPGVLTQDSISQLDVIYGKIGLNDHHPLLATYLLSIPLKIGYLLFKNYNLAVATFSLFQIIIMSVSSSLFLVYLNKKNVSLWIISVILLFYALTPIFGYYSITMWKDVIFGIVFLWFCVVCFEIYSKRNEKLVFKDYFLLSLVSILLCFLRNNGVYIIIFMLIFILGTFKKQKIKVLSSMLIVVIFYFLIKGPVFDYYKVTKSSSAEYIGMPLQQIGRIVWYMGDIDEESRESLEKLVGISTLYYAYSPDLSDGIKFSPNFNIEVFNENKMEYLLVWLRMVKNNPSIAIDAYLCSTYGYWYPNRDYWVVSDYLYKNDYGMKRDSKLPKSLNKIISNIASTGIPFFNLTRSIGLLFWISLTFAVLYSLKKGKSILFCYTPVLGLWLTMMVASPVNGEFRYIFGVFYSLPFLILIGNLRKD